MKILHLLPSLALGGGPQHVLTLAKGLRARGIESYVIGPDGPMVEQFLAAKDGHAHGLRSPMLASLATVRVAVRGLGIDLIHVHGKSPSLLAPFLGRPVVRTFHGLHYEQYGAVKRRLYFALERFLARHTAAIIHLTDAQHAEALEIGLPGGHVIPNGIDVEGIDRAALPRASARAVLDLPPHAYVLGTIARLDPV